MTDKTDKKSSLFVGHFAKPGNIPPPGDPITITAMVVDVDRITFFAGNPRLSPNEKYAEIKESIRESGLDNPLPISRRPDDPLGHYIIYKGGNTRLRALKALWEETKDPHFLKVRCEFHPFVSDTDALIAHLRENDLRGGLTFIDRAMAVQNAKRQLEAECGEKLSLRQLEAAFKQRGFPISNSMISKLEYAASLHKCIPTALRTGMGRPQIERLQKLETAVLAVWRFHGNRLGTDQQCRESVFFPALSSTDGESWAYEVAETAVQDKLLAVLPQSTDAVLGNFKRAMEGKELQAPEPAPSPPAPLASPPRPPDSTLELDPLALPDIPANISYGDLDDANGLDDWLPSASPKEVVVVGRGQWLTRIKTLRERNYELAVKLADGYVPKGRQSITKLDVGYGFIMHDVFNIEYVTKLFECLRGTNADQYSDDAKHDADASILHAANLWWFLVEVSATFPDNGAHKISCPQAVLAQHVPADSYLYDQDMLHQIHPVLQHSARLRTWWLKLPDKHQDWVFELVRNTTTIIDTAAQHAAETGEVMAWGITT